MKNVNRHISNVNIGNTDTSYFVLNLGKQRYDSANLPMNVGISYTPSGKNIEMDFSWYLGLPAMTRDVLVAGVYKPNLNNPRLFQNGDVYRIWRNNGNVEFYVNGLLDGTFPDKYPDRPMYLEAVFYDVNKKVENLYIYKEVLKTHDTIQSTEMVAKVDGYKRGFNGQERDDEVSGKGNSYTAEFWQYSPRLGKRWNLDPKPNISISPYATFGNNPTMFSDPYGDTIRTNKEGYENTNMAMNGILDGKANPINFDADKGILTYDDKVDISEYSDFQKDVLGRYKELISNKIDVNLKIVDVNEKIKDIGYQSLNEYGDAGMTVSYVNDDDRSLAYQNVYIARNPLQTDGTPEMKEYAGVVNIHELGGHAYLKLTQPTIGKINEYRLVEELHEKVYKNFKIGGAIWYKNSTVPSHKIDVWQDFIIPLVAKSIVK